MTFSFVRNHNKGKVFLPSCFFPYVTSIVVVCDRGKAYEVACGCSTVCVLLLMMHQRHSEHALAHAHVQDDAAAAAAVVVATCDRPRAADAF